MTDSKTPPDAALLAGQLACWAGLTPKHPESDTHVHRGRITKQGSRLVRWAAVESLKRIGPHTAVGAYRQQVADRRGKNVGTVAAARKQIEFVYFALRDHHVRALTRRAAHGASSRRVQRQDVMRHETPELRRPAARPCRS